MQQFIITLLGTLFFFINGFLLTWLIFKKTSFSESISYTVIFSVAFHTILAFILVKLRLFELNLILFSTLFALILIGILIFIKKQKIQISCDKNVFPFILIFSFIGMAWRWFFKSQVFEWGDAYTYSRGFVINEIFQEGISNISIPNVGFYTGMLLDHSSVVAGRLASEFYFLIGITGFFETFLAVFLLGFFTYKAIYLYRQNHKLALFGAFIVGSLGPVEIWHNTFTFLGGSLAYVGLISLFILYKEKRKSFFYLTLVLGITLALSYYTASLVLILASLGFISSIFIRKILGNKGQRFSLKLKSLFNNHKFKQYLIILSTILIIFFFFSGESLIDHAETTAVSAAQNSYKISLLLFKNSESFDVSQVTPSPIRPYVNQYKFFRISSLNWQNLFILLMGLTFVISLNRSTKKTGKISEIDKGILVAMLPAYIIGMAFALLHYEQRSFSYLFFFIILITRIPKKFFYYFAVFSIIFFLLTGYFQNIERVKFFDNSEGEIKGAEWVSENLNNETVLSDEKFISILITEGYYNVTGFPDNSPFVNPIFYEKNLETMKNAFSALNVSYFVTTERMREEYILMLNFPQQPMNNGEFYKNNFKRVYDNGDVRIYDVERNNGDV